MKKKHLNTLKIASLTLMLGCFAVGGVYNHYKEEQQNHVVKVDRKLQPKYASYDDGNMQITLVGNELAYHYNNLINLINTNYNAETEENTIYPFDYLYLRLNNTNIGSFTGIDDHSENYIDYIGTNTNNEEIIYSINSGDNSILMIDAEEVEDYSGYSIKFELADLDYEDVKQAIELDIQANEATMGDSIVGAISSGLGLVGNLASEFLTGFSTLFWNSTSEELTTFGLFSLVFLGIAITMAVIKLVLTIIRGNTGA